MANPEITQNVNTPIFIGNQLFEDQTILAAEDPSAGQVLGSITLGSVTAVAGGGNTGDGTVTALALAAGGPAIVGAYSLLCVDADAGDIKSIASAVADGGNTGDGVITLETLVSQSAAKVGDYILTCTDDEVNDTIAVSAGAFAGTGNGTLTEEAASVTGAPAKQGAWSLECIEAITNGGRFKLTDPDGIVVGSDILIAAGAGGVIVWVGAGMTFKITDGSTDFAVADVAVITVTGVDGGKWELKDPDGNILLDNILLPGTALGTIAVAAGGISFTLADGATDFATDDFFTLTVSGEHGGRWTLTDPNGAEIDSNILLPGTAGGTAVFTGHGITFTLTDGATDFVADDVFTITVAAGSGKLKKSVSTSVDGSEIPKYIITQAFTDASDAVKSVGKRGIVDQNNLVFEGAETIATLVHGISMKDWLHDRGIYTKDSQHLDFPDNS